MKYQTFELCCLSIIYRLEHTKTKQRLQTLFQHSLYMQVLPNDHLNHAPNEF